jgi:hypothetical protein
MPQDMPPGPIKPGQITFTRCAFDIRNKKVLPSALLVVAGLAHLHFGLEYLVGFRNDQPLETFGQSPPEPHVGIKGYPYEHLRIFVVSVTQA